MGQLPLWSPMLFAGYPFAANPLSGIWYLPGWFPLLFSLPLGFNLNLLIHLFFSGMGMWLFLRESKFDWLPAIGGTLAWELMPKIFAHFAAGHLTLIYAVSWTPWLLLLESRRKNSKFQYWSGVVLATIFLADVRWAVPAGMLWLAYSAWRWFIPAKDGRWFSKLFDWIKYCSIVVLLAVIISAPLLFPLAEFSSFSTRSLMDIEDNLSFSLSPIQLFGLIAPDFGGYAEWYVYFGGMFLLVMIWILTRRDLRNKFVFWLAVLACTLLLSLGNYFPPNRLIAEIPGMDLLRVPSRFMILFGFACAVLTAAFLQANHREGLPKAQFWGNLLSVGLVMFSWVIVTGLWLVSGSPPSPYIWGAVILTAGTLVVFLQKRRSVPYYYYQAGLTILLLVDLGSVAKSNFSYIDKQKVLAEKFDVASALGSKTESFRVYSPSYSIPQQTAAERTLETINGIDPLQLREFTRFFHQASGIPDDKYSVTVPPFEDDDLSSVNQNYPINTNLIGWLNVKYIVSAFDIANPELLLQKNEDGQNIYLNQENRPRAWVQPSINDFDHYSDTVSMRYYSPNRIDLEGTGPGYLVLSEVAYPGWQVWVDGEMTDILEVRQLFRGVYLPSGKHQIIFTYRPVLLYLSLAAAVLGWMWVIYQTRISWSGYWRPLKKSG